MRLNSCHDTPGRLCFLHLQNGLSSHLFFNLAPFKFLEGYVLLPQDVASSFIAELFTIAKRWNPLKVHQWMNKQNVVTAYNGMLFSLEKEGNSNTHNMDELEDTMAEIIKYKRTRSYDSIRRGTKSISTSERQKVQWELSGGAGKLGKRISV